MTRAERFEDEKRRIIESCFSKTDANGQLSESYITHIRIVEDAAHPSSPPPPDSNPDNKKPRLIIIAVRNTGRVRMHKARENNNGSFSIGKTWNLEELSAIETFAGQQPPRDDREAQYRQWAGSVGFVVTITKPYYWQAGTSKEKDFFIASAVKIYRKYTKGLVPELKGFDEREQASILGAPAPQQQEQPQAPPVMPAAQRQQSGSPGPAPPRPPFAQQREGSRDGSPFRRSPGPPGSSGGRIPSDAPARARQQVEPPYRQGQPAPRPFASSEQMRPSSREPPQPGMRPGTSPSQGFGRGPSGPQQRRPSGRAPSQEPSISQDRDESPAPSSTPLGQESLPPALQVQRSPRQRSHQQPASEEPQQQQPPAQQNGAITGAQMMAATRQKWAQHQQQEQQQQQQTLPRQRQPSGPRDPPPPRLPSGPQLPPLDLGSSEEARHMPQDRAQHTATSEVSSTGLDFGEAAAMGGMPSFYGAENEEPAPPPPRHAVSPTAPTIQEPSSPPTPERSKRRPPMESRPSNLSEASFDLRPPPLKQGAARTPDDGSHYGTPETGTPKARSALPTPAREEAPEVKPLAVSGQHLDMPGAFADSPQGPSPSGTPAETPASEKTQEEAQATPEDEEAYRPGLGPMIKKRAAADKFRKAAAAANAFKPRAGGAAARILQAKEAKEKGLAEPDGITGVVPRPQAVQSPPVEKQDPIAVPAPTSPRSAQTETPKVEVSSPGSQRGLEQQGLDGETGLGVQLRDESPHLQPPASPDQVDPAQEIQGEREIRQPQVKVKRRSQQQERYLAELGIDRSLLDGKGLEFETLLTDFGWTDGVLQPKQLIDLESDLRRELGRVEAGSWLSHHDAAREERVTQVETLLDKAIAECDELEGLLTLYSVELGSLNEDIAFIEAQSQGLQVQSANQKLLHTELQGLVDTMSLDSSVLKPLRYGEMTDPNGLAEVEASLAKLYHAIVTIDPSVRMTQIGRPKSRMDMSADTELGRMAALRQKKDTYTRESAQFAQRLLQQLDYTFTTSLNSAKSQVMKSAGPGPGSVARLNKDGFTIARTGMWMYSPLILFAKELNPPAWQTILRLYYSRAMPLYKDAFKENIAGWKRAVRKQTGEEAELLFTHQEKETADGTSTGLTSTARKLTVKRSQTLAKTLRNASGGDKHHPNEPRQAGANMMPSEIFAGALDEMAPLISQEQNFVVELFHASSMENIDFIDAVSLSPPDQRRGVSVLQPRPLDPDREMARRVTGVMEEIFGFFTQETSTLLEWSLSSDPIQGVGVMANLSKHTFYLQDTSQEFILQMLDQLSTRLQTLWAKFVDDQIRAIEDTKVKIHKRKGVMRFMRVFPHFSAAVENVFSAIARTDYDGPAPSVLSVRQLVDDAYAKINRAMFDSLKVIAKESPTAGAGAAGQSAKTAGGDDPEDKEMLNYHVLIIENMNHYIEEVDDGGKEGVLADWRNRAMMDRLEALEAYVGRVIRRPLGRLLVCASLSLP